VNSATVVLRPPLRIVLADDQPVMLEALREFLEEAGYRVVACATDGPGALECVAKSRPDLLLTDLRMPGLTGLEVASELRIRFPQIPVIILSAYDDAHLREVATRIPVAAFLVKGSPARLILRAIEDAAGAARGRELRGIQRSSG